MKSSLHCTPRAYVCCTRRLRKCFGTAWLAPMAVEAPRQPIVMATASPPKKKKKKAAVLGAAAKAKSGAAKKQQAEKEQQQRRGAASSSSASAPPANPSKGHRKAGAGGSPTPKAKAPKKPAAAAGWGFAAVGAAGSGSLSKRSRRKASESHDRLKARIPSLAPRETPRLKGSAGIALPEINLAYIDANPVLIDATRTKSLPKSEADKDANLLESKNFNREQWMKEQQALTAAMSSMYEA